MAPLYFQEDIVECDYAWIIICLGLCCSFFVFDDLYFVDI